MCGISGILNFNSKITLDELKKFNNSLKHRGPDSEGYHINNESNFGIGNRRLKIIDETEKANQPLSYLNRYWITFNGCIYNYLEIKKELIDLGYKFTTNTDTEVLLKSYVEWGELCQKKFNGDWGFAIWDDLKKEVFLSRDRFSVKPLYYFYDNNKFAFASEIKAFKNLNYPIKINSEEILELSDNLFNDNKTYLKKVYSLDGGCSLKINLKKNIQFKRWWETKNNLIKFSNNINDQLEYFKYLIEDSIKIRLRTDARYGFTISGGLDSSILQAFTNKNLNIKTNSFFVDYPNSEISENKYYEILKKNYQNNYNYINFYDYDLDYDKISKIAEMLESFQFFAVASHLNYSVMSKNNLKVSIDGHGPDELLGGYPFIYEELINKFSLSLKNKITLKELQNIYLEISNPDVIKDQFITKKINIKKEIYKNLKLIYKKFLSLKNFNQNNKNDENFEKSKLNSNDNINDELYDTFHNKSLPIILKNIDRSSMANSVEVRSPYLDWRIVVFLFSISSKSKIKNGYNKYLLRHAGKDILVNDIRLRKKKVGWQSPMNHIYQKNSKIFLDVLNDQKFIESDLWNGKNIKQQVEKLIKEKSFLKIDNYWKYFNAYFLLKNY